MGVEPSILIVARDILQAGAQFFKGGWVDLAVLGKTGMDMLLQLLDAPGSAGHHRLRRPEPIFVYPSTTERSRTASITPANFMPPGSRNAAGPNP